MSDININFAISEPINANLTVQELGNVALTIDSNIAANFGIDGVTYNITNNYTNVAAGPAGAIQYSDGSNNFLGSNNLSWNANESILTIVNAETGNAQTAELQLVDYYGSNALNDTDQDIVAAHARGNRTNPAPVETGDDLLRISGWGYTGVANTVIDGKTGWAQGGGILWQAQGNTFTANYSIPSLCVLYVGNGNGNSVAQGPTDFGGFYNFTFSSAGQLNLARLLASNNVTASNSVTTVNLSATTANVSTINATNRGNIATVNANFLNVSNIANFSANIDFIVSGRQPNGYIKGGKVQGLLFVDYTANSNFDYDLEFYSARGNATNPEPVQANDSLFVMPGFAYTGNGTLQGPDSSNTGWAFTSHHMEVQVSEVPTVPGGCPSTKIRFTVSNATANNNFYRGMEFDQTGLLSVPRLTVNETTTTNSLSVITTSNLGAVGNVFITGGSNGQVLVTNGSGNLSWQTVTGTGTVTQVTGTGSGLGFSLAGNVTTAGSLSLTVPDAANLRSTLGVGNVANLTLNGNTATFLNGSGNFTSAVTQIEGNGSGLGFSLYGNVSTTGNLTLATPNVDQLRTTLVIGTVANVNLNGSSTTFLNGSGLWANIPVPTGNIGNVNLNGNGSTILDGTGNWIAYANSYNISYATENVTLSAATGGNVVFDVLSNAIQYQTANATANVNINVRANSTIPLNAWLGNGQSVTITYVVTTGNSAYTASGFQIDGSNSTVRWAGGVTPTPVANSVTSYTYTIIKTSTSPTYTVLGSATRYST